MCNMKYILLGLKHLFINFFFFLGRAFQSYDYFIFWVGILVWYIVTRLLIPVIRATCILLGQLMVLYFVITGMCSSFFMGGGGLGGYFGIVLCSKATNNCHKVNIIFGGN